jgi:hypothetical protein
MASAHELKTAAHGRMTESIAKELNEFLCAIVINSSTCLRMPNEPLLALQRACLTGNWGRRIGDRESGIADRRKVSAPLRPKSNVTQ